jgi:hypothetical protein
MISGFFSTMSMPFSSMRSINSAIKLGLKRMKDEAFILMVRKFINELTLQIWMKVFGS